MQRMYEEAIVAITGASTGLGRAIAVGAAEQGAKAVVINYASNATEAEETARQILGSDLLRREHNAPLSGVKVSVGQGG